MNTIREPRKLKHSLYLELSEKTGIKYESIRTYFYKKGLNILEEADRKHYLAMSKSKLAYLAYSQVK